MNDTTIETKLCTYCSASFDITQSDMDFYSKISPKFGERTAQIPTPTLCPDCRQRRRLSFRNERKLYRRQCDASHKSIISIYSPDKPYTVYDQSIWWSDSRDSLDYEMEFDSTRTFTEQFGELMKVVPCLPLINMNSENSEYCNPWLNNKDCYMINSITDSEWCIYWRWVDKCDFCIDCYAIKGSKYCSNSVQITNCYSCHYSSQLEECSNCWGCVWLVNKQYCINNKQYTKEEYQSKLAFNSYIIKKPDPNLYIQRSENCAWSNIIFDSKNCINCNDVMDSIDMKYCQMVKPDCSDCIDCTLLLASKLNQEIMSTLRVENALWAVSCRDGNNIYYSNSCYNSSNIFGCIWLRNKQYCIFNKQYTKEEYNTLVPKIIQHMMTTGEWWEFFHPSLSPFWYNETVAQEYFPLISDRHPEWSETQWRIHMDLSSKESVSFRTSTTLSLRSEWQKKIDFANLWYSRSTYESPTPQVDKAIRWQDLPDMIDEVDDSILKSAVICEVSGKPFRIIPQELAFYRKHNISLPKKHPDVRHMERMELRK